MSNTVKKSRKELLIVLTILAIAAFFRLYDLSSVPPGLYPDEAMNGNNALVSLETAPLAGEFKLFYPDNNGREGLFINIQAIFINFLGNEAWVLRLVSAIFGILTVWGLYLLAKELFDKNIAYLSSFLLAISFWHVNFSRIGFRAIMLPFILVFGFYFLWRGLKHGHLKDFILSGLFWGLGFHSYISYRVAPLIVVAVLLNYWSYLKKDFSLSKYEHARQQLFRGIVVMFGCAAIVFLPLLLFFFANQELFLSRSGSELLVFSQDEALKSFGSSVIKTLGMFNFYGDYNWRHNIAGSPQLVWPVGALFAIGFIKEFIHWFKREHSHFSTTHTLLFSWFFIMLLPGFLSTEAPHALRTIGVIPVVMIFAAKGLWWIYEKLHNWFILYDPMEHERHHKHLILNFTIIIFLLALSIIEFTRYFRIWAPNVSDNFTQEYVDIAHQINLLPQNLDKYVVVKREGVPIKILGDPKERSLSVAAQTVMFLTDTFTYKKQLNRNIYYLTENEYENLNEPLGVVFYIE